MEVLIDIVLREIQNPYNRKIVVAIVLMWFCFTWTCSKLGCPAVPKRLLKTTGRICRTIVIGNLRVLLDTVRIFAPGWFRRSPRRLRRRRSSSR